MEYLEDIWLVWKEKFVRYWTNQVLHFGVLVTSGCEGCHAHLKALFGTSQNDLKGSFDKMKIFWELQHARFTELKAAELGKVRTRAAIPLFSIVQTKIWDKGLDKALAEIGKLPRIGPPIPNPDPNVCGCSVTMSEGIPCLHTIYWRQETGGLLLLSDFHLFWQYTAPNQVAPAQNDSLMPFISPAPLGPASTIEEVVEEEFVLPPRKKTKTKGRPTTHPSARAVQSNINRCNVLAASSTQRNPSAFEYPSTAPAALPRGITVTRGAPPSTSTRSTRSSARREELTMSSARIDLIQGNNVVVDRYEAGTAQPRAYDRTSYEQTNLEAENDEPDSPTSVYDWSQDLLAMANEFDDDADMVI